MTVAFLFHFETERLRLSFLTTTGPPESGWGGGEYWIYLVNGVRWFGRLFFNLKNSTGTTWADENRRIPPQKTRTPAETIWHTSLGWAAKIYRLRLGRRSRAPAPNCLWPTSSFSPLRRCSICTAASWSYWVRKNCVHRSHPPHAPTQLVHPSRPTHHHHLWFRMHESNAPASCSFLAQRGPQRSKCSIDESRWVSACLKRTCAVERDGPATSRLLPLAPHS